MSDNGNSIPAGIAREIARQGEVRLSALMSLGTASDARAATLCGIFCTAFIALAAAVLAEFASDRHSMALIWSGTTSGLCMFIAAILAAIACAPGDWYVAGGNPDLWRPWSYSGGKWIDETSMLDALGVQYASAISTDKAILERDSKRVIWAMIFAIVAAPLGVMTFFMVAHYMG